MIDGPRFRREKMESCEKVCQRLVRLRKLEEGVWAPVGEDQRSSERHGLRLHFAHAPVLVLVN